MRRMTFWREMYKVFGSLIILLELKQIFHVTPTRATIAMQKSTKYVKYARCFPMGNFSFICGRHEQKHQIKDELCDKKPLVFSVFAYKYYQLKKINKKKLAVQYFACLVLVATVAIEFIQDAFYFAHHFHSLLPHISLCAMWASCMSAVATWSSFFRFVLFWLRRCGLASPGRLALESVPELHVSSFRHAAWLNFAGFGSSGDFFAYLILLSAIL